MTTATATSDDRRHVTPATETTSRPAPTATTSTPRNPIHDTRVVTSAPRPGTSRTTARTRHAGTVTRTATARPHDTATSSHPPWSVTSSASTRPIDTANLSHAPGSVTSTATNSESHDTANSRRNVAIFPDARSVTLPRRRTRDNACHQVNGDSRDGSTRRTIRLTTTDDATTPHDTAIPPHRLCPHSTVSCGGAGR